MSTRKHWALRPFLIVFEEAHNLQEHINIVRTPETHMQSKWQQSGYGKNNCQ
jgi:hypothetical protein